jgi:hypothetical protein
MRGTPRQFDWRNARQPPKVEFNDCNHGWHEHCTNIQRKLHVLWKLLSSQNWMLRQYEGRQHQRLVFPRNFRLN